MPLRPINRREWRGVTLVELLVGLAVGGIVLLAVVSAWGYSVRASTYTMEAARLHNDLRSTMQIISQDLRRADGGVNVDPDRAVRFSADGKCIKYFVQGNPRGARFADGVFQILVSDNPDLVFGCDGTGPWVALYDDLSEGTFRITDFASTWASTCYPNTAGGGSNEPVSRDPTAGALDVYPRCTGIVDVSEVLEVQLSVVGSIGPNNNVKTLQLVDRVVVRNNDVQWGGL